tara:strand:- start:10791 stop:11699 length:909 start_codon:yes stop_codon:yes gene_type:complete
MKKERVLITGCGGMLGQAVYSVFTEKYKNVLATDIDLNESWLSRMDVRDIYECEKTFIAFKPDIVLHLAALTDLEYCESNPDDTWGTNSLGTENIALLAKKYNPLMINISTAGIFGGEKEFYSDFDFPNPLNYYAKSKYHGECFVEKYLSKYFTFRAGWMMGGGIKKDKKFINKIYAQIKSGKTELFVVDDKFGTPTYTFDFAKAISKVIETEFYGTYNQVCSGHCNRFEVATEFINLLDLSNKIKITTVNSNFLIKEYFAPRPHSEQLINLKLITRGINYMRDWKVCLKEYSKSFKSDLEK